jgi:hypothetical protein
MRGMGNRDAVTFLDRQHPRGNRCFWDDNEGGYLHSLFAIRACRSSGGSGRTGLISLVRFDDGVAMLPTDLFVIRDGGTPGR